MQQDLLCKQSAFNEFINIGDWWSEHCQDEEYGGFVGQVNFDGSRQVGASKGIVLNTRILWFFSQAAGLTDRADYRQLADRAYHYLLDKFEDKAHGGVVWELDYQGNVLSAKKQTYAQCFAIYALCAYYQLTGASEVLDKAVEYFELVERYCRDNQYGGYIEALDGQWQPLADVRLSDKDQNTPKSMNTHLHVLEAFSALYKVKPEKRFKQALTGVIDIFIERIIDPHSYHQKLFFDMQWNDCSTFYSYGHDIECSWLLWEALEILDEPSHIQQFRPLVINMAKACAERAMGDKGQMCDEFIFASQTKNQTSVWWVQAEALVGLMNAYRLSGDKIFRQLSEQVWDFIQTHHIDHINGEWHWLALEPAEKIAAEYKVGFWKAPYHNGRAMMELCRLLES
ncbi:AGE family epimerase/isomerase [Neptunicella sp. SCSIO 80796]|uniref:AGE family epimerase/isomerase n=1 Tax=Neptunicella plasticusilytica TaxID=3117012 RepID=UPI003A4E3085